MLEKHPDMAAVTRSRSLQVGGYSQLLAGVGECQRILLPSCFVEIGRKQPTGLIQEQRVDPYRLFPFEVQPDDFVSHWVKDARLAVNLLSILWAARRNGIPILLVVGSITPCAIFHPPANSIHILSPAEQASE